ncbi:MAG: Cytochrome P450, partial [uncultured Nocardioides sp.]
DPRRGTVRDRRGRRPRGRPAARDAGLRRPQAAPGRPDGPAARPRVAGGRAERGAAALPAPVRAVAAPPLRRRVHPASDPGGAPAGALHPARARTRGLRRRPGGLPRRQGQRDPRPDDGRALGAAPGLLGAQAGPHAADAGVQRPRPARLRRAGHRGGPGRGRLVAAGPGAARARPDELPHPRGDPARRLRGDRRGPAGRAAAPRQPCGRHLPGHPARLRLAAAAAPRAVAAHHRERGRAGPAHLRRDPGAPSRPRPHRAHRRALTADLRRGRWRRAHRHRAARPARHPAARGPRDHRHRSRLGAPRDRPRPRAAHPLPGGGPQRRRRLARGRAQGVDAPAPRDPDGGAHPDEAGDRRRPRPARRGDGRRLDPHLARPRGQPPGARGVPARALPRPEPAHRHVDPLRRRRAPVHRRRLLPDGGRGRPARGAHGPRRHRGRRRRAQGPQHHQRAAPRRAHPAGL